MKVERLKPPPYAFTFGHVSVNYDVNGLSMKINFRFTDFNCYVETRNSEQQSFDKMVFSGFKTYVTLYIYGFEHTGDF